MGERFRSDLTLIPDIQLVLSVDGCPLGEDRHNIN